LISWETRPPPRSYLGKRPALILKKFAWHLFEFALSIPFTYGPEISLFRKEEALLTLISILISTN